MSVRSGWVLAGCVACVGCGSAVAPMAAGDAAGADPAAGFDVRPPPDASGVGLVYLPQNPELGSESPSLEVWFGQLTEPVITRWPVVRTAGPCVIHALTLPNSTPMGLPSAGIVTAQDSNVGYSVHDEPHAARDGYDTAGGGPALHSGDPVEINAAGADIPAFGTTMLYPSRISLVTPGGVMPTDHVTIDRASGLQLAWTTEPGARDAELVVSIFQAWTSPDETVGYDVGIECHFLSDATTGTGAATIPPDVLAVLSADSDRVGYITVGTEAVSTLQPGAFTVDVVFRRNALLNLIAVQ